jgi:hypothetical protein
VVRRLPVLQNASPDDADAVARPPWRWVLLGAGLAVTLWAALAALLVPLGASVAARLTSGSAVRDSALPGHAPSGAVLGAMAGTALVALVVAVGASAFLVVRFGPDALPRRGAAVGAVTGSVAWSVAAALGSLGPPLAALATLAVLLIAGTLSGALAGRIARRSRRG